MNAIKWKTKATSLRRRNLQKYNEGKGGVDEIINFEIQEGRLRQPFIWRRTCWLRQ